MSVIFMGVRITAQHVVAALSEFDSRYPDSNSYDSWLDKNTYKYAVRYNDRLYPCKHILSQATGIATTEFNGGQQTNSVLRKLGFRVVDKPGTRPWR